LNFSPKFGSTLILRNWGQFCISQGMCVTICL